MISEPLLLYLEGTYYSLALSLKNEYTCKRRRPGYPAGRHGRAIPCLLECRSPGTWRLCKGCTRGQSTAPAGVEAEHTFAVFPESLGYETIVNYNFILTLHITLIIDISV